MTNASNFAETPASPTAANFVSLFLTEQQRIYCFLVSLTANAQDAEDLLQETAAVLFQKFGEFRQGTSFFSWSCQTARYLALNYRRKKERKTLALADDVFDLLADVPSAESEIVAIRRSALNSCLGKLPPIDRKLFERRYADSISVQTMAAELGRSASSVCRSLGRVRHSLIDCVRRFVPSSPERGGRR